VSGYIASARVVRAAPRLARAGTVRWGFAESRPAPAAPAIETLIVEADPAVAAGSNTVVDRVAAIRERWSQLTFFLFDPNSWR
jgi:hypothetical protein